MNLPLNLLPESWVLAWWQTLAPLAVQGTVLLAVVAVVDLLLPRRTWPQLRRVLWLVALVRLVLPPGLGSPVALARLLPVSWGTRLDASLSATDPARAEGILQWASILVTLWLVGVVVLSLAGFGRAWRFRRGWRSTKDAPPPWLPELADSVACRLGLRRTPPVLFHPDLPGPCVLGLLRPRVLLPKELAAEWARLTPEQGAVQAEPVLAHEFAHLKRKDLWVAAAVTAVQVVYWFHPLVWWARLRLNHLTEQCCDRTVMRALGHDTAGYRRALLRCAAGQLGIATPGLGFVTPRNALLVRLALLEEGVRERPRQVRLATGALAAGMLACVLPMAPAAEDSAAAVAEMIERPPGCLPLRYLVLQRLAEEDGY
jgi:beta-lactamase regulating signal transducer with metallopeptidase domain